MSKKKKKKQRRLLLAAVLTVAVIGGGVFFFRGNYTRAGGETVSVEATELDLRNSGLSSLEHLHRCTALRELDVRGNDLSAEEVERFSQAVPGCTVRWDIPVGEYRYDSSLEELTLDTLSMSDWENLLLFPALRKLSVNACDNAEAVEKLTQKGVELRYNVSVGQRRISSRTPVLTVEKLSVEELNTALPLLPELETLRFESCALSDAEKLSLREQYPEVLFVWDISVSGKSYQSTAASIAFDKGVSTAELKEKLPLFPLLRDVDISACGYSLQEINELCAALPELHFIWSIELLGKTVSSDDKEMDLSGIEMTDTAAVEAALPWLPNLEKVIMTDCGFSDEEMDALNKKYDDVRFVWTVYFGTFSLRTDATAFIAAKYDNWVMLTDKDCVCLKYCTDLVALDLGHMAMKDISFVNYMPHLKYLIIVEAYIDDITPLAGCKELTYLELFKCPITDISPLLEVKTLRDLNICYIWIPTDLAYEQLSQMTWLDRLWYCGTWFTEAQKQELQALMPDCEMDMRWGAESTGGTWRKHEHYYEMRDAFDMYYMPGGTNGVNENGEWVVIAG